MIENNNIYSLIPSVDKVLTVINYRWIPNKLMFIFIKSSIEKIRLRLRKYSKKCMSKENILKYILNDIERKVYNYSKSKLRNVVNGTGVILHTNLGRSVLTSNIIGNLYGILTSYSNLEFDVRKGRRKTRGMLVERILCKMSGAEDAFVVNNNAAAVLLSLNTLSYNKEVIISRGELVEIGGAFRLPDIILKGNSIVKEVGTTNCTYLEDYEQAISNKTGLILKVHRSNYDILGYTREVSASKLIKLSKKVNIPVAEDVGSATFVDLSKYGLKKNPTIRDYINDGVDLILFSGDKIFGGPQSGIILGKKKYVNMIRQNPLSRVLRIDKISLFLLENTLQNYWDETKAVKKIPTLKMVLEDIKNVSIKSKFLCDYLTKVFYEIKSEVNIKVFDVNSVIGGGSSPSIKLPSKCLGISIKNYSENKIENFMRNNVIPIVGRVENGYYLLDLRTISLGELNIIKTAFANLLKQINKV